MFQLLATAMIATITLVPALPAAALIAALGAWAAPLALLAYLLSYGLVAGLLSLPFQWGVQPGKFQRDVTTPLYRARRLYGLCWTAIFYCPGVLHLFLSSPALKTALLRLFGYRGALDVTFYPDTWVRDLPLLDLHPDAYLANKATVGTNTVLTNGQILVDRVRVEAGAVVGHAAALGAGSRIGEGAELGFSAAVGMKSRVGARTRIGGCTAIEHGVSVGKDVVIGVGCVIASRARIADGLVIPAGTLVPARTALRSQEDVEILLSGRSGRRRRTAQVEIALEAADG